MEPKTDPVKLILSSELWYMKIFGANFCQAQTKLQLQLELSLSFALILFNPTTHPPAHPPGLVVELYNFNFIVTSDANMRVEMGLTLDMNIR